MLASLLPLLALVPALAYANNDGKTGNPSWDNSLRTPFTPITLNATDGSISATFIPYAAGLTNLWVADKNGVKRDIALGYDNLQNFSTDASHPNFGTIVGRYANRIKNNTYTDPVTGQDYYSVANENDGADTLHGGPYGWSWRTWTVTEVTSSSVTFSFFDPAGVMGFPGSVTSQVKYSLYEGGVWDIDIYAQPSARTPILLSSHVYWNLDGYSVKDSSVKDWYLSMPFASKVMETDSILIPTGGWKNVSGTAYDFTQPKTIGNAWNETLGYPGIGGYGYDTCWVNEEWADPTAVKLETWSPNSGIKLSVTSNQRAIQVYTCGGQKGTIPVKSTQMEAGATVVEQNSCMVIEMEDVIGAVNYPDAWDIDPWYSPSRPYEWHSSYTFSTV